MTTPPEDECADVIRQQWANYGYKVTVTTNPEGGSYLATCHHDIRYYWQTID